VYTEPTLDKFGETTTPSTESRTKQKAVVLLSRIRKNEPVREFLAEFVGTFVLALLGGSTIAETNTSRDGFKETFAINWSWGVGVMMGVLIAGQVTGGHLNPAVTLALAIAGRLPWAKVPLYWISQYLGAFSASACVLGVHYEAIQQIIIRTNETFRGDNPGTAAIFATYPRYLTSWGGFGEQILGSFLLMLCLCAIKDKKNNNVSPSLAAVYYGFTVMAVGICFGGRVGYGVNPAHDLMSRLLTLMAGWGIRTFQYRNCWSWMPVIGPHIGAILGVAVYFLFVEAHWPDASEEGTKTPMEPSTTEQILDKVTLK
jgi:MIP family channel proteins